MKKTQFLGLGLMVLCTLSYGQDWSGVSIPANAGSGKVWQIQNQHSDDFNYNGKNGTFRGKWLDNHRAGWSGPGETLFSSNHSDVTGGKLRIKAGRVTNRPGKTVYCGHVTTKNPVMYPVFTEVRMKCSGINLSSNFWLISPDDVNEIDVTETYGAENYNGRRMATNYHIFRRSPFLDLANSPRKYLSQGNVLLKNGYHRFGLHWVSATEFKFYFDGVLVRTLNRSNDLRDPRNRFFDQPMHLIMNTELHTWKSNAGIRPSNAELNNNNINKMYIDWIRTYKPVNGGGGGGGGGTTVHMRKRNSSGFAIDGGNGGANGQNVYLWSFNSGNVNQKWVEINRGGGFYSYQKKNTNYCLDGGNGGANGQNVYLWTCNSSNQNQHWKKVNAGSGHYRLEKRNAPAYSIDGNNGGANGQSLYLWSSSNTNQNQQWQFSNTSREGDTEALSGLSDGGIKVYPNPLNEAGVVTVEVSSDAANASISVISLQGEVISQGNTGDSGSVDIDLSSVSPGTYIISVQGSQSSYTEKLIVQ